MRYVHRILFLALVALGLSCGPTAVPKAPAEFHLALASSSWAHLAWIDKSDNEDGFVIERGFTPESLVEIATTPANVTVYDDYQLQPSSVFFYRVTAYNSVGLSDPSAILKLTTPTAYEVPPPPTQLAGVQSGNGVKLSWVDNSSNETGFKIQRATMSIPFAASVPSEWQLIATTYANVTAYEDIGLQVGATYAYRIAATSPAGDSAWTNPIGVTIKPGPKLPNAPRNLEAAPLSDHEIQLTWIDAANNELHFVIERATPKIFLPPRERWTVIAVLGVNPLGGTMRWVDHNVSPGMTYAYKVRAENAAGPSEWSNIATVRLPMSFVVPAAPTHLTAHRAPFSYAIDLAWIDNAINESGFRVERSLCDVEGFETLANLPANTTRFSDEQLLPGVRRFYRVCAVNLAGDSEFSNIVYVP